MSQQLEPDGMPDIPDEVDEVLEDSEVFISVEQHTLIFYGKPIVVVRLADGRPAVVMCYLCDNMQLDRSGQVKRIQRTKAIARDLITVLVETSSGAQKMPALILRSVTYWLLGIDPGRARPAMQDEILRYQQEAADALYAWAASAPKAIAAPTNVVPSEPITEPTRPAPDASVDDWIIYHQQMVTVLEWRRDMETWRGHVESRLEGVEALTGLIPEILERLGPEKLTDKHQAKVRQYVNRLHEATGKHQQSIYTDLYRAFEVPKYQDILETIPERGQTACLANGGSLWRNNWEWTLFSASVRFAPVLEWSPASKTPRGCSHRKTVPGLRLHR